MISFNHTFDWRVVPKVFVNMSKSNPENGFKNLARPLWNYHILKLSSKNQNCWISNWSGNRIGVQFDSKWESDWNSYWAEMKDMCLNRIWIQTEL